MKTITADVHDEVYQRFVDKCTSENIAPSEVLKELVYQYTCETNKNASDILKNLANKKASKGLPVAKFASQKQTEEFLLSKGWDHVLTEEDGCDSWSYPWELRKLWPRWAQKGVSGNQHYWDRDEAIDLQLEIDITS